MIKYERKKVFADYNVLESALYAWRRFIYLRHGDIDDAWKHHNRVLLRYINDFAGPRPLSLGGRP